MKIIFYSIVCAVFLSSCASMISGISLSSFLSGKTLNVCPSERQAIIEEATECALEAIREELQKENYEGQTED